MKLSLIAQVHGAGLPEPELEVKVVEGRRWRWDCCWPGAMIGVEVQGGSWVGGRHTRGKGYAADLEKLNEATLAGWLCLWVTPEQIASGHALAWIERAFALRRQENEAL